MFLMLTLWRPADLGSGVPRDIWILQTPFLWPGMGGKCKKKMGAKEGINIS